MGKLIDTTLREGEQTPGVCFTLQEKKNIIDGLCLIGVDEIEVGIASPLVDCASHLIEYCRSSHPFVTSSLWSRCKVDDIKYAATIQPDVISLSIPTSDLLINDKLGKDRSWVENQLKQCILLARRLKMKVAVGFEDATRSDANFLKKLAIRVERFGAERIRVADTIGTSTPMQIQSLIQDVSKTLTTCSLTIHTHNDFGMATANAITALDSGAMKADVTILGLGERCGCARLEELAGYLTLQSDANYSLINISPLAKYVARLTHTNISASRPFLGKDIFTCETGLHLHALQKNLKTYEPYPPELLGMSHTLFVGPKAGRRAIAHSHSHFGKGSCKKLSNDETKAIRESLRKKSLKRCPGPGCVS